MKAERWFQRELQLVNPDYFAVYNGRTKKWNIRKWVSPNHKVDWKTQSMIIMAIKHVNLDNRSLFDLRRGLWQARRIKYMMAEIDEANRRNDQNIDAVDLEHHRDAATDLYKHFKTNTVDLGSSSKIKSNLHAE